MFKADQRYYVNSQGKAVAEGDPDAQWLLVAEGSELPVAQARKYGLVQDEPQEPEQPADKAVTAPADSKAISHAPANKAIKGSESSK